MDLELDGMAALVTGGSRGIGRAIAETLAAEGCSLHLAARSEADLLAARDALNERHGAQVAVHACDLSSPANAVALAGACPDVDILINNAGAIPGGTLDKLDTAAFKAGMDLKVWGYVTLMREFYPRMCARGSGVIVNIIGMGGERPRAGYIAGALGNAGLMAMTRALGAESIDHGVRVVGINPGMTETARLRTLARTQAADQWGDPERWRETLADEPAGRPARPEEIADVAAWLASARASWVSGTVVMVDGGKHAR